jgi:hypothetical protein
LIAFWKLDGIHPELQDDVKVEDHAFSSRASVILCLTKNVIIITLFQFMVERLAFLLSHSVIHNFKSGSTDLLYWLSPS